MSSKLWPHAAVLCCSVDGWVGHWCIDVSWVWRITNCYAATLLHNIRHDQLLHRGPQVLNQGSRLLYHNLCCPELTPNPRSIILPLATLQKGRVLRRGSQVLHRHGTGVQKRSNTTQKQSWVNIFLFFHGNVNKLYYFSNCKYVSYYCILMFKSFV